MVHKHTQPTNIKKIQKYTSTQEEHIENKKRNGNSKAHQIPVLSKASQSFPKIKIQQQQQH